MLAGLRGRLITTSFAEGRIDTVPGAAAAPDHVIRALDAWSVRRDRACGPASPVRSIADAVVLPLLRLLEFRIDNRVDDERLTTVSAVSPGEIGRAHV